MRQKLWRVAITGIVVIVTGCTNGTIARQTSPIASLPAQEISGGCAGTQVIARGAPPDWAQAGFTAQPGSPWRVPWALGKPGDALAYVFAGQLVAQGHRPDGTSNKILWVARSAPPERIEGRPLGRSGPVVEVLGGATNGNQVPTIVDVPTPGCWSFSVSWDGGKRSTINLDVLPAGATPLRPSPSV
ncbi:MAG: hypothetical protein ACR2MZ_10385 [Candidatus Dormibacter sp.]|uniref:hypothetical protein n=1 Tax=Candidatus Dormibacter sp. TaxID=2973982 RepID=UPI003D9BE79A